MSFSGVLVMEDLSIFDEDITFETDFYEYVTEEQYIADNLIEDDFIEDVNNEEIQLTSEENTQPETLPDTKEAAPSDVSREQINEIVSQALKENGFSQEETKGNTYNIYQIKVEQQEESVSEEEIQEEALEELSTETEKSNDDLYNKLDEVNSSILAVNDNIVKASKNNDLILNSLLGGVFAIMGGLVVAALFRKINP
jgi:flagellar biosynthesis GTPase FlhF